MNAENLNFDSSASVVSVTELRGQFPNLPPRILVTLAVMAFLARTVTPFRLCACGCGESVHGKARLASPACRQRVSREARAVRATAPKQFNLVLQHEIPVTIPFSPAPRDHGSEISAPENDAHCLACGFKMLGGRNVGLCPKCGSDRWFRTRLTPPHEPATRASHTSQPHEPATRASHTSQNFSANCDSFS